MIDLGVAEIEVSGVHVSSILQHRPGVIGISFCYPNYPYALRFIEKRKDVLTDLRGRISLWNIGNAEFTITGVAKVTAERGEIGDWLLTLKDVDREETPQGKLKLYLFYFVQNIPSNKIWSIGLSLAENVGPFLALVPLTEAVGEPA